MVKDPEETAEISGDDKQAADSSRLKHELDSGILGTAKIDPDMYSAQKNSSIWDRTKYAVAGLIHVLVRQITTRTLILESVVIFALAAWLQVSLVAWAMLSLAVGINWLCEMFNTAIEATVDLATGGEIHPLAKIAKDVAAATTLFSFLLTLVVAGVLFSPGLYGWASRFFG